MQTGIHNFFQRAQPGTAPEGRVGQASSTGRSGSFVSSMVSVGMQVIHIKTRRAGKVSKLGRNPKGLIEATITLPSGVRLSGSPNLGKDFIKVASNNVSSPGLVQTPNSDEGAKASKWDQFLGPSPNKPAVASVRDKRSAQLPMTNTHLPPGSVPQGCRPLECSPNPPKQRKLEMIEDFPHTAPQATEPLEQDSPPTARKTKDIDSMFGKRENMMQEKSFFQNQSSSTVSLAASATKQGATPKEPRSDMSAVSIPRTPTVSFKKSTLRPASNTSIRPEVASAWVAKRRHHDKPTSKTENFWWWLEDRHLKDACLRRPEEQGYDPTTVHIPEAEWNEMTDFQRQYWGIKRVHFDKVILVKLGKFYEMYERDAQLGNNLLNLNFTHGGRDPKCLRKMICVGVPEASLESTIAKLVPLGYKVGIVEEMERSSDVKKQDCGKRVVERQLRRVVTPGTMSSEDLVGAQESRPLLAIVHSGGSEVSAEEARFGLCLVDCTMGKFSVGVADWQETEALLLQHRPFEVLQQRGGLGNELRAWLRRSTPTAVWTAMPVGNKDEEFWPAEAVEQRLVAFFSQHGSGGAECAVRGGRDGWPRELAEAAEEALAMDALGGALSYLRALGQEEELLSLRRFEHLHGGMAGTRTCMVLDAQTLSGLDILKEEAHRELRSGQDAGPSSLWEFLDRTLTPFGRRTLRFWVTHPLFRAADISARLDAVENLLELHEGGRMLDVERELKRLPDLERKITRVHVHAQTAAKGQGVAEAAAAQRRVARELLGCLEGFEIAERVRERLVALAEEGLVTAPELRGAVEGIPVLHERLEEVSGMFDVAAARADGKIRLTPGSDAEYDSAMHGREAAEKALEQYLMGERRRLACLKMKFSGQSKDPFFLEIPAEFPAAKVPGDYVVESTTKACKRFSTPELRELIAAQGEAQDAVEAAERGALRALCVRFDAHFAVWCAAVAALARADALLALGKASAPADGRPMCRPQVRDRGGGSPALELTAVRHPFLAGLGGSFVPNDLALGAAGRGLCGLITGPNMGGKSTMLRLACLAAVLAQVGCFVPAERCEMTAVDRVFTRLGASDNILRGLSTFMVEMRDVALVLRAASADSLVIIDELGRGTSTFDGQAIAHAVLAELVSSVGCRTLLSTHYHGLALDYQAEARVAPMHMACQVDPGSGQLVMLYRLCPGVCPTSYGCECALRVLPRAIVERARAKSQEFLQGRRARGHKRGSSQAALAEGGGAGGAKQQRVRESGGQRGAIPPADLEKFVEIWRTIPAEPLTGRDALRAVTHLSNLW